MHCRENISYLVPRDPSITCWSDRVKLPGPCTKNLIQLDEFEETMGDKIKVYVRLKPSVSVDNPYTVLNSTTLQTEAPKESVSYKNVTNGVGKLIHKFTFTSIFDQDTTQVQLFKRCVVSNLKKFLSGENYLLMAYGTTSAGKTYTMQGNVENPGVIPRALDFLFNTLRDNIIPMCRYTPYQYNEFLVVSEETLKKDLMHKSFILSLDLSKCQRYPDATHTTFQTSSSSSGVSESYENVTFKEMQSNLVETESFEMDSDSHQYSVWISMIEIYNEQVYDLLDMPSEKGARPKLAFRDDDCGNTFVKNLRYVNVSSSHEAFQILQFGRCNLHFAPTALNARSSRSHCIFTVTLAKFLDYDSSSQAVISRFSFCDLAGMERAKKTLNVKDRLVESKAINTSLSILVKCLTAIKENQNSKEKKMIPYRESKLTKYFRDAIMGKEQFSLIVNVTTEPVLFDETLSVLKFSAIAQKIVPQNVFVKPKLARAIKRSRFSRIVVNSTNNSKIIDWEASTQIDIKVKENSSSEEGVEELKDLVESLKEELAQAKNRCEQIEGEIREELTKKFSEILKKQNENNQMRLENETERIHEMYEKKERRLVQYFEIMRKNKRPKLEDDSSEYEYQENKLRELERDVETLRNENDMMKEQIKELLVEKQRLTFETSELKFKLVEKDRVLDAMRRASKANEEGCDSLEKELRSQLDEANMKISNFKKLLDEAASDHKQLEEQNKYLENENEVLEQKLTEQLETVGNLKWENNELQCLLSTKRVKLEKLEEENEKLKEELKTLKEEGKNEGEGILEDSIHQTVAETPPREEEEEEIGEKEKKEENSENFVKVKEEREDEIENEIEEKEEKEENSEKLIKLTEKEEEEEEVGGKGKKEENLENLIKVKEEREEEIEEKEKKEENSEKLTKLIEKEIGGKGKKEENFEKLTKQVENLSIQKTEPKSTRKKVDLIEETIHPSTIKNENKGGRRKNENGKKEKETGKSKESEKENIPSKKKGKCYKKLFTDNDFDELNDLNASPLAEISRLRPRK